MSAARHALIWGYRRLESAFLNSPITHLEVDEETDAILRQAYRYACGGVKEIGSDVPVGKLPIPTIDLGSPLLSIFPELFLHPGGRTHSDEQRKGQFFIRPRLLLDDEPNYPARFPTAAGDRERLRVDLESDFSYLADNFKADALAFNLIGQDHSIQFNLSQSTDGLLIDKLLVMLEKYGAPLPSEVEYISLFDFFRTVSAFAACIENIGDQQQPFRFLCADLSGIQDFVYGISSAGALKSLRARSFFLELVMEHAITLLIESTDVSRANLIYRGGGNFFMLLPNSQSATEKVNKISERVNDWFYRRFDGRIYLAMASVPFGEKAVIWAEGNTDFASFWQEGIEQLEAQKQQKFSHLLPKNLFEPIEPRSPRGVGFPNNDNECQICHREDMPDTEVRERLFDEDEEGTIVCEDCYQLFHLGDDLTEFRYVLRFPKKPQRPDRGVMELPRICGDPCFYAAVKEHPQDSDRLAGYDRVWGRNSVNARRKHTEQRGEHAYYKGLKVPFSPLLTADVVIKVADLKRLQSDPGCFDKQLYKRAYEIEKENYHEIRGKKRRGEKQEPPDLMTVDMSALATTARGIKRVAVLRMDVDNLGLLFSEGLHGHRRSLAHQATLSRNLTYFFSYDIGRICHGRKPDGELIEPVTDISHRLKRGGPKSKRMVTVIYSGGDDLFLVGAWSDVPEVAIDIRNHFKKFTCEPPDLISHQRFLSISAGVTVHGPKFPIYRMALASGDAEKLAKRIKPTGCNQLACLENFRQCYLHEENGNLCCRKDAIALFVTDGLLREKQRIEEAQKTGEINLVLNGHEEPIGFALSFDDFEKQVVQIVEAFLKLCDIKTEAFDPKFPQSFIQRLHLVTETWRWQGMLYVPSLKYALLRTSTAMKSMDKEEWKHLRVALSEQLCDPDVMRTFHQPLMWVGWLCRSIEEE